MTVATELAKEAASLEYILAIEGVGWPASGVNGEIGSITASTWQGRVFATSDNEGDLATQLGCSVSTGLMLPSGFSETFDPEGYELTAGGQSYTIVDVDSVLGTIFRQHERTDASGSEKAAAVHTGNVFHFNQTTLRLQYSNPGGTVDPAEEGEVVWIGGAEAVLLGARTSLGSDAYSYASCTRGYLGTPRGAEDRMGFADTAYAGDFAVGTVVFPWNQYWQGRRTMMVVRVPGTAHFATLAHGFVNKLTKQKYGVEWTIATTARTAPLRMRRRPSVQRMKAVEFTQLDLFPSAPFAGERAGLIANSQYHQARAGIQQIHLFPWNWGNEGATFGFLYSYRTRPGGTKGANVGPVLTAPQAETATNPTTAYDTDADVYLSMRPVKIGDNVTRVLHMFPGDLDAEVSLGSDWVVVDREAVEIGGAQWKRLDPGIQHEVRVLLDNANTVPSLNPFTVNNAANGGRNPIDFALSLLTSRDGEFYRADADAASTDTVIDFSTASPAWTTNQWAGYALHCVEGDNKGEARVIASNTADEITVDTAFTANEAGGNEYQIRNTIYDTLPYGFGMQVAWQEIDIDSWEEVRDAYGSTWQIGVVVLGLDDNEDFWSLLSEHVFRVFGVMPYIDRSTGKLALRYIPQDYADGILETYPSVSINDILPGAFETIETMPRGDISRFIVNYRGQKVRASIPVMGRTNPWSRPPEYGIVRWIPMSFTTDALGESQSSITVVLGELERSLRGSGRELTIDAMLCDENQRDMLARILEQRLRDLAVSRPESDLPLGLRLLTQIYAGGIMSVTTDTIGGIVDPYTGSDGLTAHLCRVLSVSAQLRTGTMQLRVQLLGASGLQVGLLAPAVTVTGKAATPDRFEVDPDVFANDGERDWDELVVGDLLELRSQTGALKEAPFTISSFGANTSTTPGGASTDVINVDATVSSSIATGDYLTFIPWASTATANMERFAAYADATDQELGSGDDPKVYG